MPSIRLWSSAHGIRHVEIQRIVVELARPSQTKLLYLAALEDERLRRVAERADGVSDLMRASTYRVESRSRLLPEVTVFSARANERSLLSCCQIADICWKPRRCLMHNPTALIGDRG
jgi:hypothetical protein